MQIYRERKYINDCAGQRGVWVWWEEWGVTANVFGVCF